MPRFFLHLVDSVDVLLDPDGTEMPADAVPAAALRAARDCMAADIRDGRIDLGYRIDVHDEAGALVHSQSFAAAVTIVRSG